MLEDWEIIPSLPFNLDNIMKKKIGELNGHSIVVGESNEVTKNEYLYKIEAGKVMLFKRNLNNKLLCITISDEEDSVSTYESEEPTEQPILDNETVQEINNILTD